MSENEAVMVATIAFGMGIDKPDIRYVCHLNLPASMEAYYQEIGRAGRDGAAAETMLLYGYDDLRMRRTFIEEEATDEEHKRREHRRLDALISYCESAECRRIALLGYFDETDRAVRQLRQLPQSADRWWMRRARRRCCCSAIHRTGQAFGAGHVIDVLLGAETDKVRQRGHDRLPTYGVGKDFPKPYWQSLVRQAVAGGQIMINIAKYGGLEITERGRAILKGESPFSVPRARQEAAAGLAPGGARSRGRRPAGAGPGAAGEAEGSAPHPRPRAEGAGLCGVPRRHLDRDGAGAALIARPDARDQRRRPAQAGAVRPAVPGRSRRAE